MVSFRISFHHANYQLPSTKIQFEYFYKFGESYKIHRDRLDHKQYVIALVAYKKIIHFTAGITWAYLHYTFAIDSEFVAVISAQYNKYFI